jgi:hypothetical protein
MKFFFLLYTRKQAVGETAFCRVALLGNVPEIQGIGLSLRFLGIIFPMSVGDALK